MVKVSFLQRNGFEVTFKRLFKGCRKFSCAVAWGTENPCLECIEQHPEKVEQFVVGTDFYQTSPKFLSRLHKWVHCRVIPPNKGGIFHPKVYLFFNKNSASAIVGSANFTNAAMSVNQEALLVLELTSDGECFKELCNFVSNCYGEAEVVNDDFISVYRTNWEANKGHVRQLHKFKRRGNNNAANHPPDPIQMTWQEFVKEVKEEKNQNNENRLTERLEVLKNAHNLFSKAKEFSELNEIERKKLAGTIGEKELRQHKVLTKWWWFGTMRGSGVFQHLVNDEPRSLSLALKAIPPFPKRIEERDYKNFITNFQKACENRARRLGIAPASRLLAMKRPDYFVCFNDKNKKGLSKHFGVKVGTVKLDTYWDRIIKPMHQGGWWNSKRPEGKDGDIWDGRAALLDAIYYDDK